MYILNTIPSEASPSQWEKEKPGREKTTKQTNKKTIVSFHVDRQVETYLVYQKKLRNWNKAAMS